MKWKFWRKDNPLTHLDPHMLAVIMVGGLADHTPPFDKWRTDENPIPERVDPFVEVAVNVYQLSILLDFVERKFGADVSGLVRSHLIVLMSKGKIGGEISRFFDAVVTGRALPEREQFFADRPEYQIDCNVAKSFLSVVAEPEDVKTALYPKLGQSLTLGRISAESCFGELIKEINFSPISIFGLRKPDEIPIQWSQECGCFERQLQRRDGNALFPPERRRVSAAEVTEARAKDLADLRQLEADFKEMVGVLRNLPDRPPDGVGFDELYRLREAVEELIIRCAAVGAIANPQREGFQWVYDTLVTIMRRACPPEKRAQLDAALANSENLQKTWSNQFVAQFKRSDTPIMPDLLPSLLVEDVGTVRLMAGLMPETNRIGLGKAATVLIEDAKKEGYIVPHAAEKLRVLTEG